MEGLADSCVVVIPTSDTPTSDRVKSEKCALFLLSF